MEPKDREYTKTHEWVKISGNILTIGITAYAVEEAMGINKVLINEPLGKGENRRIYEAGMALHPISEEDLQDPGVKNGIKLLPGKTVVEINAAKDYMCVYSPVYGRTIELNERVNKKVKIEKEDEDEDEEGVCLINLDPYKDGWIAKIEILDQNSLIPLMTAEEYQKFLEEEKEKKEKEDSEWE